MAPPGRPVSVTVTSSPKGYSVDTFTATPPVAIVNRLNRDINAVLQRPAVKALLEAEAFAVEGTSSPAETAKFIADEYVKWGKIVRDAKIKFD